MKKILIIGGGIAGCSAAYLLSKGGFEVDLKEKEDHLGGHTSEAEKDGVRYSLHGPHIFHTSAPEVIRFALETTEWGGYINSPVALSNGVFYHLPMSYDTIQDGKRNGKTEEQLVELLFHNYTLKQWGKLTEKTKENIKRLPKDIDHFGHGYFKDVFQGIPVNGFQKWCENLVNHSNITVSLNYQFDEKDLYDDKYFATIYTAPIDLIMKDDSVSFQNTDFQFEEKISDMHNAVYNIPDMDRKEIRITDYNALNHNGKFGDKTIVGYEIPNSGDTKCYPIVNNDERRVQFIDDLENDHKIFCAGRFGRAEYLDMDKTILSSMNAVKKITLL